MGKRVSGPALLFVALAFSLVAGDVLALAVQDPQTPPTTPQTQTTTQTQTRAPRKARRSRTPKRKRGQMGATTTGDQATTPADTSTQTTGTAEVTPPAQSANMGAATMQEDLSGTYTGTFNCAALGLTGPTTLTVTGNQFTTSEGVTGRIVATQTRGYTAVALQAGEVGNGVNNMTGTSTTATNPAATTPTATTATGTTPTGTTATGTTVGGMSGMTSTAMSGAPQIVSLRAHRAGNRLTLTSIPGATMPCSFRTTANTRRSRQNATTAGATVATPPEAGPTPADVTAPARPARNRRGSTRRNQTTTTPAAMPNSTNPTTQPTPESPMPMQTPRPAPSPSPSPGASPTPSGSPQPSPTVSPMPSPSPSPSPGRPRG